MIFLPEAQKKILSSPVADMINSASGSVRAASQSLCFGSSLLLWNVCLLHCSCSAQGGMGSAVGGYCKYTSSPTATRLPWMLLRDCLWLQTFGRRSRMSRT